MQFHYLSEQAISLSHLFKLNLQSVSTTWKAACKKCTSSFLDSLGVLRPLNSAFLKLRKNSLTVFLDDAFSNGVILKFHFCYLLNAFSSRKDWLSRQSLNRLGNFSTEPFLLRLIPCNSMFISHGRARNVSIVVLNDATFSYWFNENSLRWKDKRGLLEKVDSWLHPLQSWHWVTVFEPNPNPNPNPIGPDRFRPDPTRTLKNFRTAEHRKIFVYVSQLFKSFPEINLIAV